MEHNAWLSPIHNFSQNSYQGCCYDGWNQYYPIDLCAVGEHILKLHNEYIVIFKAQPESIAFRWLVVLITVLHILWVRQADKWINSLSKHMEAFPEHKPIILARALYAESQQNKTESSEMKQCVFNASPKSMFSEIRKDICCYFVTLKKHHWVFGESPNLLGPPQYKESLLPK